MSDHDSILLMLADASQPLAHRMLFLREVVNSPPPQQEQIAKGILERLSKNTAEGVYEEKNRQLDALLREMQDGAMRSATFVEMLPTESSGVPVALVVLDDGVEAYTIVPKPERVTGLRLGDRVILDGKGRVLLRRGASGLKSGDVARLERGLDERHVEVTLRAGAERAVFLASQDLLDQIKAGQVKPGAAIITHARRSLALAAIPPEKGLAHYQFLDTGPVPNVSVDRDIGDPPGCIEEVTAHLRLELTQPALRRRYRLRRCHTRLLCGVSGTGKSLAIDAIHRRMYEVMGEVTGVGIEQLPPRVFRIRQDQILSVWLGQSEKNWQRALDEALQLADEVFTTPDGRQFKLPVLIVLEEIDGLGRARGPEAIHDRILSSILQSLDPARLELRDRLVLVMATTNEPQLVDPAMLRRVGGAIETFHRLKRRSFIAVLEKLTRDLPATGHGGLDSHTIWREHIQTLAARFFSPNASDQGLVELTYAGTATPVVRYRRDFLTAALLDRAVQQAAAEASQAELNGADPGITLEQLARALEAQLKGIVDQLREQNVGSYTDLPDGVRVSTLRRIAQPAHASFEFHRN